jgi:hypothetical protein
VVLYFEIVGEVIIELVKEMAGGSELRLLWHVARARKGVAFVGQAYQKFQSEMKCAEWCFELMGGY